jgi:hypothetical protein
VDAGGDAPDTSADGGAPDGATTDAGGVQATDAGTDAAPVQDSGSADAATDAAPEAGAPSLVALRVSEASAADASPPLALIPPFSPGVHDYYVRCGAGTNALTVSMTASEGSTSLLAQPVPSPSLPQQTLPVSLDENQALVAAATNDTATVEYWVRCLPNDFPQLQWTPHANAGTPPPGYYLVGTALPTTSGCYAMVLDGNGVPVWYFKAQPVHDYCVFDVDSVVNGSISFDAIADSPAQFELHQLAPLATTSLAPTGLNVDLHELRALPNGDYLVISSPEQPGVNLTGMQVPLPDGGVETPIGPQTILACNLVEFRPDGTVVWSWSATDHFDAVADSVAPVLTTAGPTGNPVIDPFHCNSIDVDPGSGNLLVSAREMSSIFMIEKSTGRVLWKMGGATASKDGATYVAVADPFSLEHDARLQPDWSPTCNGGSGHISLYDDESNTTQPARAVVYDVVVGGGDAGTGECGDAGAPDGGSPGTATVAWQYRGTTPSLAMGSFRITPDGSRVIGWGLIPGAGFTEVDGSGHDLLDFGFSDGNTTYRAIKVPPGAFDLEVLRRTAGLP